MRIIRKLLMSARGVSMPEVMIGLGMMGISGAFLAKLSRDADQKNLGMRARVEEREFVALVKSKLGDVAVCNRNFSGNNVTRSNIDRIVDENGATLFASSMLGSTQGIVGESQAIQVTSWSTSPFPPSSPNPTAVDLNFNFSRVKETDLMTSYSRSIKLFAKINGSTIGECFGVRENVQTNIKRLACNGGATYDEATDTCSKTDLSIQSCASGQFLTGIDTNNGNYNCDGNISLIDNSATTTCSNNQIMMGFNASGQVDCQNLQFQHFSPFFPARTVAGNDLFIQDSGTDFQLASVVAPTPTPSGGGGGGSVPVTCPGATVSQQRCSGGTAVAVGPTMNAFSSCEQYCDSRSIPNWTSGCCQWEVFQGRCTLYSGGFSVYTANNNYRAMDCN